MRVEEKRDHVAPQFVFCYGNIPIQVSLHLFCELELQCISSLMRAVHRCSVSSEQWGRGTREDVWGPPGSSEMGTNPAGSSVWRKAPGCGQAG